MVDGKQVHGGLTDRFRNILSVYQFCKEYNIHFYLHYNYPCELTEILVPNEYDWRISTKDLSYNYLDSKEIYLFVKGTNSMWESSGERLYNNNLHLSILKDNCLKQRRIQFHEYGNAYFAQGSYNHLFNELFRPSSYLQDRLDRAQCVLPTDYEAVTLRFQQLLGDFIETGYDVLSFADKELLISSCIDKINHLYLSGYFSTDKILVTSDSQYFLKRISDLEFVCVVPGRMEHMDYTHDTDLEMNSKSFVDLFLLMRAKKLTLLKTGKMYKSGFPEFAAELGEKPYEVIIF